MSIAHLIQSVKPPQGASLLDYMTIKRAKALFSFHFLALLGVVVW